MRKSFDYLLPGPPQVSLRGSSYTTIFAIRQKAGWPEKDLLIHLHGINLWEPFNLWYKAGTLERKYSTRKFYCISDDGSVKCSANQQWRIDTIRRISQVCDFRLKAVEWMPQEFKGAPVWRPGDLDQAISVDVYWKAAMEIWGIDIRKNL
jgi:hypothetical protein